MNKYLIVSRVTKDLELKEKNGTKILAIPVAINTGKTKEGEQDTTFIDLLTFNKTAENCNKYLSKGSLISAECIVKNNNYTKEDGTKVYGYKFIANNVTFLDSKKENQEGQAVDTTEESQTNEGEELKTVYLKDVDLDDSLPF